MQYAREDAEQVQLHGVVDTHQRQYLIIKIRDRLGLG